MNSFIIGQPSRSTPDILPDRVTAGPAQGETCLKILKRRYGRDSSAYDSSLNANSAISLASASSCATAFAVTNMPAPKTCRFFTSFSAGKSVQNSPRPCPRSTAKFNAIQPRCIDCPWHISTPMLKPSANNPRPLVRSLVAHGHPFSKGITIRDQSVNNNRKK